VNFTHHDILDDIWLSFYPGAKIGVLGPNGAGKSSLLRIMAGVDTEFQGEAWAHKGTRIGYLPQEPELDGSLDVRGNVELAVKAQRDALNEFNEISLKFAEPDADFDKLMDRQGKLQEYIDQYDLWNLDNKIDVAMDAPSSRRSLSLPASTPSIRISAPCAAMTSFTKNVAEGLPPPTTSDPPPFFRVRSSAPRLPLDVSSAR
jgi:ATPase subunit of ABC transporter with duplicated ATPase domains